MLIDPLTNRKRCPCCKDKKDRTQFNKCNQRSDGLRVYCRTCQNEQRRVYRALPDNVRTEKASAWAYKRSIDGKYKGRDSRFKYVYGITHAQYDNVLLSQNGCCAICDEPSKEGQLLCVDHNHDTGIVRGLLCKQCNFAIGLLKDSVSRLEKAKQYLNKYQSTLQAVA